MSYQQKISRGCDTCRKRRIRCDRGRPVCGQCIKSNRECLGYRDLSNVIFRNQTGSPPKRHREKDRTSSPPKQKREKSLKRTEDHSSSHGSGSPLSVASKISETAESRALVYFLTHYVQVMPEEERCKSYVDHLVPMYLDSNMSMRLFHATSAVSMLTLAKKEGSRSYVEASRINYGKAVAMLREAVADPHESRTDDTLMTAMILSLYDSIDANRDAPSAWRHHVDGAFAMLTLRETFDSPVSQKLYWAVKFHAAINHIMRCEPITPFTDLANLWKTPIHMADATHCAFSLALAALRVPALRSASSSTLRKPMSPATALEVLKLLGNVKVLDAELACWPFSVPAPWRPSLAGWKHGALRNATAATTECYPGPVYGHYNWWIANVWNMYRSLRCYCQGLVQSCVERLVPADALGDSPEYVGAARTQQRMVNEICATVPICLGDQHGFTPVKAVPAARTQDDQGTPQGPEPDTGLRWSANAMSGFFLIWSLETAASVPAISRRQRAWILGRLAEVGRRFSIGLATISAAELESSLEENPEVTFTHLERRPFEPYADLEELWEEEQEAAEPNAGLVGIELKVEHCIADLARRYSELQVA